MKTAAGRRRFTYLRGIGAERVALLWLVLRGYRLLARRFSAAGGEIDLVMRRGRNVVFVEVKARDTMPAALTAIDHAKRRKLGRAARAWIARHPAARDLTFRADLVALAPGHWPRHVVAAFPLDLGG